MNDITSQVQRYFKPKNAVRAAYRVTGSWREVSKLFGFGAPAMWRMAAKGHISRDNENRLRLALRLPPRRVLRIDQMSDETIRLYMRTRC
jgi:hypothetical protein